MNIVLVGLMGSGKTAVGRLLAERLGRPFVDTDRLVEADAGRTVADIFAAEGEEGFRRREAEVVARAAAGDNQVIATGGGAVLRTENREALRRTGFVIWLDAEPETLYDRARGQGLHRRPLLSGPDPLGRLRALAAARRPFYAQTAHVRICTDRRSLQDVVAEIMEKLQERGERG
ncbi:shikimate kinase [Symbiobacterium thermophilum]|uniref:Shikimate kinase n=1 Tax=Symbiobacterium thermophilum TaxID=2734 RepID=A0A953LFG5_SYMTR|nr:shikimate kinase [Symbiobacterium thermophilum]MBY6277565.1 shikimate kinase [Symbiobacterium thermophilum]